MWYWVLLALALGALVIATYVLLRPLIEYFSKGGMG